MACVRTPAPDSSRHQQVREFRTLTRELHALRAWLIAQGVTQVVMQGGRGVLAAGLACAR
jgi:hypothetical protein